MQRRQASSTVVQSGAVFARRLREERDARGLSQNALAELASEQLGERLQATAVTRIERGEQRVYLDQAVAIAAALELDLSELLEHSPAMTAEAALTAAETELADLEAREQMLMAERQVAGARVERLRAIVEQQKG